LAIIALKNQKQIFSRNRAIIMENLVDLESFISEYDRLFDWKRPKGGCIAFPRYIGADGVEAFCKSLIEESGVLLLPASLYASELTAIPDENFRIGFGRSTTFKEGLQALRNHIATKYPT
jgi:aspartate/methionine/tyrosine aminotransferase